MDCFPTGNLLQFQKSSLSHMATCDHLRIPLYMVYVPAILVKAPCGECSGSPLPKFHTKGRPSLAQGAMDLSISIGTKMPLQELKNWHNAVRSSEEPLLSNELLEGTLNTSFTRFHSSQQRRLGVVLCHLCQTHALRPLGP